MKPRSLTAKLLLLPLSKIYGAVTWSRNKMFDMGMLKQRQFGVPIITVGNISVGGTGKTPHTEYIVGLLRRTRRVGVLSRGYKRKTHGFVLATPHSTPHDIGDESYQIYHKFGRQVMTAVCEDRVAGIAKMLEIDPSLQVIVLDDAFQHRYVKPDIAIVLTEFDHPVYDDTMLPYGTLRESPAALSRADIVIATKCRDDIKPLEYTLFDQNLNLIPDQSLFFSRYRYDSPRPLFVDRGRRAPDLEMLTDGDSLLAVCGIGNPRPFVRYLKSFDARVKVNVFPDHHDFTRHDMEVIEQRFDSMKGRQRFILTTEKDAMRLINNPYFPHRLKPYIFYIPVHVQFIERDNDRSSFNDALLRRLDALDNAPKE